MELCLLQSTPLPACLLPHPPAALGALLLQANLWTEYVATQAVAEYMLVPRVCAMAEALWSPRGGRDWQGFKERLRAHEGVWQRMGINYRPLVE